MLGIIDKIHPEDVFVNVEAESKEEALKIISEKIAEKSSQDQAVILQALSNRENEESTGIGRGIAVPHGKIEGIGKTHVFVFVLANDIDYDALDNEYVKVIFALLADENDANEYVTTLSQLFFILNQRNICEKIFTANEADELLEILKSAKELEKKFETEGQIKYLIELQRADSQVYMYELWEAQGHHEKANDIVLEEYKRYRENLHKKITPEVLDLYNRISEKYSGRALSKIENFTCSACHIAIPKVTVNEVRRLNQIITCFNCGRILFTV